MTIEADIRTKSLANAGLAALVGTRFTPVSLPEQSALPAITYQLIAAPRAYAHDGDAHVTPYRYQFTIHASSLASGIAVASAMRTVWSGFKGVQGGTTFGACFIRDEIDDYQPDQARYWRVLDIEFQIEGS